MITFGYDCPHCKTRNTGFTVTAYKDYSAEPYFKSSIMANCNKCKRGIIANFALPSTASMAIRRGLDSESYYDLEGDFKNYVNFKKITFYPSEPSINIPPHLPENVEEELKTAERLFLLNNDENNFIKPAGNAYRTTLERALCELAENDNRAKLNKRIEKLFEDGKLTKDLKNFAMHIRSLSAEASHTYNDFTFEELEELKLFTQLFLQYTFTLPAMIPDESRGDITNNEG